MQALLHNKLGRDSDRRGDRACQNLDLMPIAITQAAAFINNRKPRFSVAQYLAWFQRSDRKRTNLLKQEQKGAKTGRDWEAKLSIMVTWQILFEHIRETRSSATHLLSFMCFFDRQAIPDSLLRGQYQQDETRSSSKYKEDESQDDHSKNDHNEDDHNKDYAEELDVDEDNLVSNTDEDLDQSSDGSQDNFDEDFGDDIQTLKDFYFISINKDGTTFGIHALVQLAMRYWLESNELLEHWKSTFTNRMLDLFPTPEDPENKGKCRLLYPHVLSASSFGPTRAAYDSDAHILRCWTLVLHLAARYALERGRPREALKLSSKSMEAMEESTDPEDSQVLGLLQLQAFVQSYCGLSIEAENHCVRSFRRFVFDGQ